MSFAATGAALAGIDLDLREGSLLEPVAGENYDLIVSNPPFVISPGWDEISGGFPYRDSGLPGDALCRDLVGGLGSMLSDGGTAQILANWAITGPDAAGERVRSWLPSHGIDAWIWQREVADPGEYVSLWLRDAGEAPGRSSWRRRYDNWREWFQYNGVVAIGMGLINLRQTTGGAANVVVCEDVVQAIEQPIGAEIANWFSRARWLADRSDERVLSSALRASAEVSLLRTESLGLGGWQESGLTLTQTSGLRWQLEADEAIVGVIADAYGAPSEQVQPSVVEVCRDLLARGILLPPASVR